jgi:hypothetical protein
VYLKKEKDVTLGAGKDTKEFLEQSEVLKKVAERKDQEREVKNEF